MKPIYNFKFGFDTYFYKELGEQTYKDADYIKRLFNTGDFESILKIVSICFNLRVEDVTSIKFRIFIRCLKTIKIDLEKDSEAQKKLEFFSDEKVKMSLKMSNSEVMNQFGIYNVIEGLSKGDKTKWHYFENLQYNKIMFMITFNTLSNDVNKRFEKNYQELTKLQNG